MLKIYGHPWSINTRKVLAAIAEKGARAELVLVDLPKGGQHAPEHVARHPFAKAPVLEDRGFLLYESLAIVRYVDRTCDGPPLTPADPRAAALMDQWISVQASYFGEAAHALIVEAIFKPVRGLGEPDMDVLRRRRDEIARALEVADRRLSGSPYLAGETFSLAEITWLPYLEYLSRLALGRDAIAARPNVRAWWQRISERPAWIRTAREGDQPPIGAALK